MAAINQVVNHGFSFEDSWFTYKLASGITAADVGKAVALDTTAAGTVKLAGDDNRIFGRLETFEDRVDLGFKVGTVARRFKAKFPVAASHGIDVGESATGSATAGAVKAATSQNINDNICVEVGADYVVLERI